MMSSETNVNTGVPPVVDLKELYGLRHERRKDMLKFAPSWVRLENQSHYGLSYRGEKGERPKAIQREEEGINGLETAKQTERRKKAGAPGFHPQTDHCFQSVYCKEFVDPLHRLQDKNTKAMVKSKPEDRHSWVEPIPLSHVLVREAWDWKPRPAVHLPEDPAKLQPMKSTSTYKENFMNFSKTHVRTQPIQAGRSEIADAQLLTSFNGIQSGLPKSLYQESFVGQQGVDRWKDREVRHDPSSIVRALGPSHEEDSIYWKGVGTQPYWARDDMFFATVNGSSEKPKGRIQQ
ncbi:hypothetical protein CRM22_009931 [Opisthorchis felineus]|uniref:Uncharacterized protein n=1 Tax=Opisthorchis felineus TaxID=147828 RepID=A0A4S2LAT0_OPIFE|nr:hypothetical protein CRM22_009931 [Opisthorchis felineus]TGZ57438.1 hypothetical protein CRM22_009931 [Opisthorchis felineus]